ncbi:MAG: primosomal protein N' [bacterium]
MFCDVVIPKTRLDGLTYEFDPEKFPGLGPGDCVRVRLRGRKAAGIVVRVRERSPVKINLPVEELIEAKLVSSEFVELVNWTGAYYFGRLGEVLNLALPASVCPRVRRRKTTDAPGIAVEPPGLARDGVAGFDVAVCADPDKTASRLAEFCAERLTHGSVIILAPSTDNLRLAGEGGAGPVLPEVVELVAGAKPAAARAAWRRARDGHRLVLGTRSAVFAPVPRLGGIAVLDEHDPVFKEERRPRYNARDAAVARARMVGCPVLLCDPTPSLETWHNLETGSYRWLDRPGTPVAPAAVVDMRTHRGEMLSPRLLRSMDRVRAGGGATVLYANRLGVSRGVTCRDCGNVLGCAECHLPMVLFATGGLACRFCGHTEPARSTCPECGGGSFAYRLPGVDLVAREVRRLRPDFSVAVVTGDESEVPQADVVVGTKALLNRAWPGRVGLVAAVRAEDDLALPDFRSGERLFAVLWRLGRRAAELGAEFTIQTRRPEEPALSAAAEMDVVGFYSGELKRREETAFPPLCRLVVITVRDSDEARSERGARNLARRLGRLNGVEVLGPIPTAPHRPERQLLVKLPRRQRLDRLVTLGELARFGRDVRVDVDPQEVV